MGFQKIFPFQIHLGVIVSAFDFSGNELCLSTLFSQTDHDWMHEELHTPVIPQMWPYCNDLSCALTMLFHERVLREMDQAGSP